MTLPLMLAAALILPGTPRDPGPGSRSALAPGITVITNVNVVPMHRDTVLRDVTVVIRDGRIAAVGPARRVSVPRGARRIDGTGRYLIPGLADMHTHLFSDGAAVHDSAGPAELGVILANGITAARIMIGTPAHLGYRREIEGGSLLGPQLWIASPQLAGRQDENTMPARSADEARAAVNGAADAGYDFLKLTLDITPTVYDAIVAAAAERRLPLIGHVDPRVGVSRALAAGQHVEHLDNYLESMLADSAPMRTSVSDLALFQVRNWTSLDHMDEGKLRRLAGETARSGTYTTPTLNLFRSAFGIGETDDQIRRRPDWDLMPAAWRRGYLLARQRFWSNPPTAERRARYVDLRGRLVKAIADSGGRIMAGSDSPEWLHLYGFALHRELQALVAAGLTPYQALRAATVTPAAFVGASEDWGTIEVGKRADLVLLSANPLADIANSRRIERVSLGGRWLDRAALDSMIARGSGALQGRAPDSLRADGGRAVRSLAAFGFARAGELAPGVHAVTRAEPLGLAGNANSLVIVGDTDVVVVDAQFTRQATLETIAVIRSLTPKPVRVVINTHWHDDHMAGNQVYRDSFPGVRFVAHANTATDFAGIGAENRRSQVENATPAIDRYARLVAGGVGVDSTPVSDAERAAMNHSIRIMRQYIAEAPGFVAVTPDQTVSDRLVLRQGAREIQVRWFGDANTRGDLVVWLPAEGVVATGDLVVAPVPYAFNSFPGPWMNALDSVAALQPRVLLPGHGPVMRDLAYLRSVREMLGVVNERTRAAAARGDSLTAVLQSVTLEDYRQRITNDEKWANWMFRNFFLRPAVRRAFELGR